MKFTCDGCFKDVACNVLVQCAECEDVDLCLTCFCAGVELSHHKASHAYRVLRPLDFVLFSPDWRADEELLLLEGCEQFGLGNWKDIAEHVGGCKDAQACETHYIQLYLQHFKNGALDTDQLASGIASCLSAKAPPIQLPPTDASAKRARAEEPAEDAIARPASACDSAAAAPVQPSAPSNHEVAGYMPGRREFETETENDAEVVLKDMQFSREDDSVFDLLLKLAMLDIYSAVLERRAARRRFVHEHGLLDFKKQQAHDKARGREDRDTLNAMKAFARFMSPDVFDSLHCGLTCEEELRRRNQSLQEYRRHGLRTFAEVARFEAEKKHLELYLKGGSTVPRHHSVAAPVASAASPREPFPLPAIKDAPLTASASSSSLLPPSIASSASLATKASTDLKPASTGGRKASTPLNINNAEGIEFLSEKEKQICSILRLYPRLYLSIKDTLIREYNKCGGLKRAQARAAVKIDVNKTSKLYDFFISAGWIKPPASGE